MIKNALYAGVLAAFASGPSSAQIDSLPDLRIIMGSTALLSIDKQGEPVVTANAATGLTSGELDMLGRTLEHPEKAVGEKSLPLGTRLPVSQVGKDQVRFSFVPTVDGHSVLLINNGFDQGFAYKARIGAGDKSQGTDVCEVLPNMMALEHWPYEVEWIEIRSIQAVDWQPGQQPRCE